jgi:hypothetical protein
VDYLAVAVADEGSDLRKAGITCSIMIMNPELTAFKTMFDYKLEPEVYSFHLLNELIKAAEKEEVTKLVRLWLLLVRNCNSDLQNLKYESGFLREAAFFVSLVVVLIRKSNLL